MHFQILDIVYHTKHNLMLGLLQDRYLILVLVAESQYIQEITYLDAAAAEVRYLEAATSELQNRSRRQGG